MASIISVLKTGSNRDIVECKEIPHTVTSGSTLCSNRDIVECKGRKKLPESRKRSVVIET